MRKKITKDDQREKDLAILEGSLERNGIIDPKHYPQEVKRLTIDLCMDLMPRQTKRRTQNVLSNLKQEKRKR